MKYRIEHQLSVRLQNTPGQLAEVSALLAQQDVSLSAITLNHSETDGVFRFTTCDPSAAASALEAAGYAVAVEDVLSIRLQDSKGKLASLARALSDSGINVDYMYASVDHEGANSRMILKVSNIPLAIRVIDEVKAAA